VTVQVPLALAVELLVAVRLGRFVWEGVEDFASAVEVGVLVSVGGIGEGVFVALGVLVRVEVEGIEVLEAICVLVNVGSGVEFAEVGSTPQTSMPFRYNVICSQGVGIILVAS
jgi:hypothetical protein